MRNFNNELIERAISDPEFDYFSIDRPLQPKADVGAYIKENGFSVPLIESSSEWRQAYDTGAAMLRSELPQDYDGLSGLLRSEQIREPDEQHSDKDLMPGFTRETLRQLRDGKVDPTTYMLEMRDYLSWNEQIEEIKETLRLFGGKILDFSQVSASRWRFIEGSNVTVFADPHVEGRYHFGVIPAPKPNRYQGIGDYTFEKGEYHKPQQFRKHDQPFVATDFVEYYEQIRNLPFFDATQCPVLELQQDTEGDVHFLQYLKTGKTQNFTDPFELPTSDDTVQLTNVRGITPPDGRELRMFIQPEYLTPRMEGQAIFCGLIKPFGLEVQLASQAASFILHEAYISFKTNHFDSSPMFRPPLAAGVDGCQNSPDTALDQLDHLLRFVDEEYPEPGCIAYMDIKVTSNGHQAALESDWSIKQIPYENV